MVKDIELVGVRLTVELTEEVSDSEEETLGEDETVEEEEMEPVAVKLEVGVDVDVGVGEIDDETETPEERLAVGELYERLGVTERVGSAQFGKMNARDGLRLG